MTDIAAPFSTAPDGGLCASVERRSPGTSTLAGRIVAAVRADLFAGRLKPGAFLGSEHNLARRFGVSRICARDATRTLQASGVVEVRTGAKGGASIAYGNLAHFADALAVQFTLSGVREGEILDAQSAVEGMAAELAATNASTGEKRELSRLFDDAEHVIADQRAFTESSLAFHLAIADASHNRALSTLLKAFRHVVWPVAGSDPRREVVERVLLAHRAILRAIETGDGVAARALMCRHLGGIRDKKAPRGARVIEKA